MRTYKKQKGIILAESCDQFLLVASKEAREHCPAITQINETSAFIWNCMSTEEGISIEQLLQAVSKEYLIDDCVFAENVIQEFVEEMMRYGYVLPVMMTDESIAEAGSEK